MPREGLEPSRPLTRPADFKSAASTFSPPRREQTQKHIADAIRRSRSKASIRGGRPGRIPCRRGPSRVQQRQQRGNTSSSQRFDATCQSGAALPGRAGTLTGRASHALVSPFNPSRTWTTFRLFRAIEAGATFCRFGFPNPGTLPALQGDAATKPRKADEQTTIRRAAKAWTARRECLHL